MVSASVYRWGTCFDRLSTNGFGNRIGQKKCPGILLLGSTYSMGVSVARHPRAAVTILLPGQSSRVLLG